MKLLWVKIGTDVLVGESIAPSSVMEKDGFLTNPMIVQIVSMPSPQKVIGQPPQTIQGYKLLPLPCGKIFLVSVSYFGVIDDQDPMAETYMKIRQAMQERAASPLMAAQ